MDKTFAEAVKEIEDGLAVIAEQFKNVAYGCTIIQYTSRPDTTPTKIDHHDSTYVHTADISNRSADAQLHDVVEAITGSRGHHHDIGGEG